MGDVVTVAVIVGVVLLIVVGFFLIGFQAERRKTPQERQIDRWQTQAKLLDRGCADPSEFESVVRHYKAAAREEWELKLVRYRALIDAGMSQSGAIVHVLGSPDGATNEEQLGPRGEEVIARAIEEYRRNRS